jgi:small subunit ribosomal protein S16
VAITLRLTRLGQRNRPFYRIIAANSAAARDGRFLEIVGTYNPMMDPPAITLKETLIKNWIAKGAKPSATVQGILKRNMPGVYEEKATAQRTKIQEQRRKRKERAKAAGRVKAKKEATKKVAKKPATPKKAKAKKA